MRAVPSPPADPGAPRSEVAPAEPGASPTADLHPYAYATIRVVPRVERGECVNTGVVLFCRPRRFLAVRSEVDAARLLALAPDLDLAAVRRRLDLLGAVAAGEPGAGAIARLPQFERFGWLVAPASTVVQPGPVHAGLCADPAATLERLFAGLVRPVGTGETAPPERDGTP